MIRLNEIKMPLGSSDDEVKEAAAKFLNIKTDVLARVDKV